MNATKLTEEMIRELCILTTRDEAGRHFTTWSKFYDELESLGLCEIHRPIHAATGIPYDCQYWSVEATPEGLELVEANPELHAINVRSEAYNTGYEAAVQGEPVTANPYPDGSWDADQWSAGWADA